MKVVGLVSGGKDSCYAMMKCSEYGHEIVALANLMPVDDSLDELDSHMYQTVGHQIVVSYAECMGLPLFRRRIQGSTRHQSLSYRTTPGDEVEDMFILLDEVKQQIPSISAVSTGAIASDYQRLRVESVCSRLGLVSLSYLWKQDQSLLLQEMISKGVVAVIVKVAALGLKPAVHLGSELAQLQPLLLQLNEKYGINVCGEGGEYETLTLDCPLFTNARIVLDDFQVILHSPDSIASVGILHPLAFHLEHKNGCKSEGSTSTDSASKMVGFVHEVQGANVLKYGDKCMSTTETHLANGISTLKEVHISKTNGDTFSIGCWIQDSGNSGNCDLESGLAAVLQRIESELVEGGYCWADVLYIHLYIADMNSFALANETYVRFITEKKCHLGVPSRSTIELPLLQVGLGEAFVEVLVTNEKSKKVLHVQSVSCWAPSCIGPYSQATLYKGVLYMAGQLGLDPPTMMLCSGGAAAEMEQALKNCEAVASCYNCSLPGSSILLVVYCASSLDASERPEIQKKLENIVGKRSNQSLQHENVNNMHEPVYLYVLAPNLPKGGLVEVKPICYVPDNEETTILTALQNPTCTDVLNLWGFQQSDWHGSCCQEYVIPGKICSAVLSITEETAARVSSQTDQCSSNVQFLNDKKHLKSVVRFCIYLLDEILGKNDFSWVDLMNLRIYFTTSLCLSANGLSAAFVEAYDEFARLSQRIEMVKEPIFNLMPVIGSGRDTTFRDLITCELFASKL